MALQTPCPDGPGQVNRRRPSLKRPLVGCEVWVRADGDELVIVANLNDDRLDRLGTGL
jgi:hypothetical protein